MKQVRCKSGLKGWQAKLRTNYKNFEEFFAWDETYGLAKKLGYHNAAEAWDDNPTIRGSVNPGDFEVVERQIKNSYCQKGTEFYSDKKCTIPLRLDNLTAKEWAAELFEYEYCSNCGKDQEDHFIIPFNGHWFAKCKDGED